MDIKKGVSLKDYSTFKIGGPARFFCVAKTIDDVKEAIRWAGDNNERIFILGGGSNVLFGDESFDGLVIKMENSRLELMEDENPLSPPLRKGENRRKIVCGAGVRLSELVLFSIENNLTGLEWATGIPGTVGGAVRGNAGAFGKDMKDNVVLVKALKIDREKRKAEEILLDNKNCKFGYRDSVFKKDGNLLIWEVELGLEKGEREEGKKKAAEFLYKRKEKQPASPSAGSIFQNPQVALEVIRKFEKDQKIECRDNKVPAGWLVDQCDLRGKKIGGAQVSDQHANFIINNGDATAEDVIMLISIIKQKVRRHFKVQLREEIEIVL